MERLQKHLDSIKVNSSPTETKYDCDICKDSEFIIENNAARPCKCREVKNYHRILDRSGISKAFQQKTFDNYNTKGRKLLEVAKNSAIKYAENFEVIKSEKNNSICFLGQVGSGKTHLTIAIANELMKKLFGVRYMQYREVITQLKQNMMDEEYYQNELNKYKQATVLLIDDLFKGVKKNGQVNETDLNIMFEIINYRYIIGLPIIVSSEYGFDELLDFDEAIGSRIIEMCRGRAVEFEGQEFNYRLG